ncbi:MAG: hypothetical protein ACYDA6_00285 [Solirubrobacteraceae bacterium]
MSQSAQAPKDASRSRQVLGWLGDVIEPLVGATIGLVLGAMAVFGVPSQNTLAAATLLVLSALGFSLVRERGLRIDANGRVERLGRQQDETTAAVNAIQSGNPYSVLLHETTWDIEKLDGSLAVVTRLKKLRIDQNNVFALYDFSTGDGERQVTYSPGHEAGEFFAEGRICTLVALGRVYYRGDHLDFRTTRTVHNGFMGINEAVSVETRDPTELMRLTVKFPTGAKLTGLRLSRATPTAEWRNEDVLNQIKDKDERPTYETEIPRPERGGSIVIEWDWEPSAASPPTAGP